MKNIVLAMLLVSWVMFMETAGAITASEARKEAHEVHMKSVLTCVNRINKEINKAALSGKYRLELDLDELNCRVYRENLVVYYEKMGYTIEPSTLEYEFVVHWSNL